MSLSINDAQNLAEDLYGAEDPEAFLAGAGYEHVDGKWVRKAEKYQISVTAGTQETEAGMLRTYMITAEGDGTELFTLPTTRYIPKEVSP